MTTTTEFNYETTTTNPGYNPPQKMGRKLWAPMLAMALMAWPVGLVLSWIRAAEIATAAPDAELIARLGQLVPAFMFIGFLGVFSAISFAIARILGAFRNGGGQLQVAAGTAVRTLKMPKTAKLFLASMMMGMMALLVSVILHFVVAANVATWAAEDVRQWSEVLEGVRRFGVALYLFGITFGLGTIITVLRFQSIRIRQLPGEVGA
jgi:hypothetical protein